MTKKLKLPFLQQLFLLPAFWLSIALIAATSIAVNGYLHVTELQMRFVTAQMQSLGGIQR